MSAIPVSKPVLVGIVVVVIVDVVVVVCRLFQVVQRTWGVYDSHTKEKERKESDPG
jgi:hypothetical protein